MSVLRRLLFAASNIPNDHPNFWELAVDLAERKHRIKCKTSESIHYIQAKTFVENILEFDAAAFSTDRELLMELMDVESSKSGKPMGIILISTKEECCSCGSRLQLRKD